MRRDFDVVPIGLSSRGRTSVLVYAFHNVLSTFKVNDWLVGRGKTIPVVRSDLSLIHGESFSAVRCHDHLPPSTNHSIDVLLAQLQSEL